MVIGVLGGQPLVRGQDGQRAGVQRRRLVVTTELAHQHAVIVQAGGIGGGGRLRRLFQQRQARAVIVFRQVVAPHSLVYGRQRQPGDRDAGRTLLGWPCAQGDSFTQSRFRLAITTRLIEDDREVGGRIRHRIGVERLDRRRRAPRRVEVARCAVEVVQLVSEGAGPRQAVEFQSRTEATGPGDRQ